jgi:glycosyltransferase involved in cell wall biosynthesis
MHVLFIHRAFPAQFGRLALELTRRHGWKCSFLVEHLSLCPLPSPEMLAALDVRQYPRAPGAERGQAPPWPQAYGHALERGQAVFEAVRARPDLLPDLVIGHGGLVPTFLLREQLHCPLIDYCEYYFAQRRCDLTYRQDLPLFEHALFYPRCINAATLVNLLACDAGYTPTRWQRQSFPERFRSKIEVHPDGIDTELYRPRLKPIGPGLQDIPAGARIVTFVARGLEALRGFDLFMALAQRIARRRADAHFVIAGAEETYYGWDLLQTGGLSFKAWTLARHGADLSRFHFLGHIDPEPLAHVLARSDLHVYLSMPFVVSWSLLNALSSGCVVLAGDTPAVREVIEPGHSGLLEPLFDLDRLEATALQVLDDPAAFRPLGQAGRLLMEEQFSVEVAIPGLKDYFERVASGRLRGRVPLRHNTG